MLNKSMSPVTPPCSNSELIFSALMNASRAQAMFALAIVPTAASLLAVLLYMMRARAGF
jgi:hypothetical protein